MSERRASRRIIVYAFFLVIAIMMSITSLGLSRIQNLSTELEDAVQEHDVQIALMHTMRHAALERALTLQSLMLLKEPSDIDDYVKRLNESAAQYQGASNELRQHHLSPQEQQQLQHLRQQHLEILASQKRIIEHFRNSEYAPATTLFMRDTLPGQRRAMSMLEGLMAQQRQQNLTRLNDASITIEKTRTLMILLGIIGVLFSIGLANFISRRINREIELRQNSENELRHSELRERIIRENIVDGVLTLDERGTILSCNKACEKIFGYQCHELLNRSAHLLMPEAIAEQGQSDIGQHLQRWEKRMVGVGREVKGKRSDGSEFPAELDISRITLDGEPIYIAVIRDITEKKEAEHRMQQFNQELERRVIERTMELANTNEKLRHEIDERVKAQCELTHLATHDSLTELPNRTMFQEQLQRMLHAASRHDRILALFFMDLDGFKAVNDSHGHAIGDKLLVEIARRLRECIRKEDIVARMGGDEFTVLLGEIRQMEDVNVVAQKLIEAVNRPVRIGEHICHVGISIGISLFPRCGGDADTLLRLADNAMYAAKEAGKNTYSFSLPRSNHTGERLVTGFI